MALVVLVLVALSVVVALVNRQREATLLPEDTPEGTVQRYLRAIQEDDSQEAYGYLSSELQEHCTLRHFRDSTQWLERDDMRVILEDTEPLDGTVEVEVRITQFHVSPPFGSRESSYSARYTLERDNEVWRFTGLPWPLGWCPGLEERSKPGVLPAPEPPRSVVPSG